MQKFSHIRENFHMLFLQERLVRLETGGGNRDDW